MHAFIELAECRRQDLLADAARARLAKQAQPDRPLALRSQKVVRNAVRTVCAAARSALDALAFHTLRSSSEKSEPTMLTVAR